MLRLGSGLEIKATVKVKTMPHSTVIGLVVRKYESNGRGFGGAPLTLCKKILYLVS